MDTFLNAPPPNTALRTNGEARDAISHSLDDIYAGVQILDEAPSVEKDIDVRRIDLSRS